MPGCEQIGPDRRCPLHAQRATRDRVAASRGYNQAGHTKRFRPGVLARDPICTEAGCTAPSVIADHYPLSRRQLVARGMDPDDPAHGRGLCWEHHSAHTGRTTPGGWAAER